MLLLPASNAITGVIQQSEAAKAERTPALVNVPGDFIPIILSPVFEIANAINFKRITITANQLPEKQKNTIQKIQSWR